MSETTATSITSFTSFSQLFEPTSAGVEITSIEIPMIQRDYAQGRKGESIRRIRAVFIDTLCGALLPGAIPVSLDFIYGDVEEKKLYPLDGQQRLTTLFLLHWYIACRAGIATGWQPWARFCYATRPGARLFCGRLTEHQPEKGVFTPGKTPSQWLTDQAWYLFTWKHDPTVQSMLVMLDDLHRWYSTRQELDFGYAWERLTDPKDPAISFHVLPLAANDLTDDLYIKMNSRGKPLTPFENFKAQFEEMVKKVHPDRAEEFARKIDTTWSDILWHYRGTDNLIDDEFLRYFRFATEIRAWLGGIPFDNNTPIEDLADRVYGPQAVEYAANLGFLFQCFDTWAPQAANPGYVENEFSAIFTATPVKAPTPLLLFTTYNEGSPVDLFAACCRHYGEKGQGWTLADTLLLYGVMLHRIEGGEGQPDFTRQLRMLRNLIEASKENEIISKKMPELLADVRHIVIDGDLAVVVAFNKAQLVNEAGKAALLAVNPELKGATFLLEDHPLLCGCLAAFDLDPSILPETFKRRVEVFYILFDSIAQWPELTGALLAVGDYSRQEPRWTGYRMSDFGAPRSAVWWRALFRAKLGENPHPSRRVLMELLDKVMAAGGMVACLAGIMDIFLQGCEARQALDWRYYFVKFGVMRAGASGRFAIGPSGYQACMLQKIVMRSNYRDPYLSAIALESGLGDEIGRLWFSGYENEPRRLRLTKSGLQIECVDEGFQIIASANAAFAGPFKQYRDRTALADDLLYRVPQENGIDKKDRVSLGASLLRDLVASGL